MLPNFEIYEKYTVPTYSICTIVSYMQYICEGANNNNGIVI